MYTWDNGAGLLDKLNNNALPGYGESEPYERSVVDRAFGLITNSSITNALYNITDDNSDTGFLQGLAQGVGAMNPFADDVRDGQHYMGDVLSNLGWNPTSLPGKVGKFGVGLAGDILLDPLSYVNPFSAAAKIVKGTGTVVRGVDKVGITLKEAEEILKKQASYAKWTPEQKAMQAENLMNSYNQKVERIRTGGEDFQIGTMNLPFVKQAKPGEKSLGALNKVLVKSDTLRSIGDKTIAPYYNQLARKLRNESVLKNLNKFLEVEKLYQEQGAKAAGSLYHIKNLMKHMNPDSALADMEAFSISRYFEENLTSEEMEQLRRDMEDGTLKRTLEALDKMKPVQKAGPDQAKTPTWTERYEMLQQKLAEYDQTIQNYEKGKMPFLKEYMVDPGYFLRNEDVLRNLDALGKMDFDLEPSIVDTDDLLMDAILHTDEYDGIVREEWIARFAKQQEAPDLKEAQARVDKLKARIAKAEADGKKANRLKELLYVEEEDFALLKENLPAMEEALPSMEKMKNDLLEAGEDGKTIFDMLKSSDEYGWNTHVSGKKVEDVLNESQNSGMRLSEIEQPTLKPKEKQRIIRELNDKAFKGVRILHQDLPDELLVGWIKDLQAGKASKVRNEIGKHLYRQKTTPQFYQDIMDRAFEPMKLRGDYYNVDFSAMPLDYIPSGVFNKTLPSEIPAKMDEYFRMRVDAEDMRPPQAAGTPTPWSPEKQARYQALEGLLNNVAHTLGLERIEDLRQVNPEFWQDLGHTFRQLRDESYDLYGGTKKAEMMGNQSQIEPTARLKDNDQSADAWYNRSEKKENNGGMQFMDGEYGGTMYNKALDEPGKFDDYVTLKEFSGDNWRQTVQANMARIEQMYGRPFSELSHDEQLQFKRIIALENNPLFGKEGYFTQLEIKDKTFAEFVAQRSRDTFKGKELGGSFNAANYSAKDLGASLATQKLQIQQLKKEAEEISGSIKAAQADMEKQIRTMEAKIAENDQFVEKIYQDMEALSKQDIPLIKGVMSEQEYAKAWKTKQKILMQKEVLEGQLKHAESLRVSNLNKLEELKQTPDSLEALKKSEEGALRNLAEKMQQFDLAFNDLKKLADESPEAKVQLMRVKLDMANWKNTMTGKVKTADFDQYHGLSPDEIVKALELYTTAMHNRIIGRWVKRKGIIDTVAKTVDADALKRYMKYDSPETPEAVRKFVDDFIKVYSDMSQMAEMRRSGVPGLMRIGNYGAREEAADLYKKMPELNAMPIHLAQKKIVEAMQGQSRNAKEWYRDYLTVRMNKENGNIVIYPPGTNLYTISWDMRDWKPKREWAKERRAFEAEISRTKNLTEEQEAYSLFVEARTKKANLEEELKRLQSSQEIPTAEEMAETVDWLHAEGSLRDDYAKQLGVNTEEYIRMVELAKDDKRLALGKLFQEKMDEFAQAELKNGRLTRTQYSALKGRYVPHILTEEGQKYFDEFFPEEKTGKYNPEVVGVQKSFDQKRKYKTIDEATEKTGREIFEKSLAEIYLARALAHNKTIYGDEVRAFIEKTQTRKWQPDQVFPGYKTVVRFEDLNRALVKQANKTLPKENRIQQAAAEQVEALGLNPILFSPNMPYIELTDEQVRAVLQATHVEGRRSGIELMAMREEAIATVNQTSKIQQELMQDKFLTIFDKYQTIWKMWNSVINPGFHIQNALSNAFASFMSDGAAILDGKKYKEAWKIFNNADPKQTIKLGDTTYTYRELNHIAFKYGLLDNTFFKKDVAVDSLGQSKLTRKLLNANYDPTDLENFKLYQMGTKAGSSIEGTQRLVLFLEGLKKGKTIEESVENVNKFLFDYGDLTASEKVWMKRVIPFYTYMRKNVPLQLEMMIDQPFVLRMADKTMENIEAVSEDRVEDGDRNEWRRDFIQMPFQINDQNVGINPQLPFQQLDRIAPRKLFGQMSPAIKAPIEMLTGEYAYTGFPIEGPVDYLANQITPTKMLARGADKEGLERHLYILGQLSGLPMGVIKEQQ